MPNFFEDNEDILFHFENTDLAAVAAAQEDGFKEFSRYDYAPRDAEDAIDSYRRILSMVGQLSAEYIAPRAEDVDRQGSHLLDGKVHYATGLAEDLDMLAKAGVMGFTLPRKYDGLNFPSIVYTMAIEMVSRADASLMNIFGLQGIAETINAFADEATKAEYLPRFSSGEVTGAMVLTEPDAGSDLQNVQLRATLDDEGIWRLDGVKRFITNGCGDVLLVLARSEPDREGGLGLSLFLCEKGEGVAIRRTEIKLGIHGSPTCEIHFHNTPARLIGDRQRGLVTYVMALMNGARVGIAAQSLGIAQAAFNEARAYAASRVQFGRPIEQMPAVAEMLVDMRTEIEVARAITYDCSRVVDLCYAAARRMAAPDIEKDEARSFKREHRRLDRLAGFLTPLAKYYASEMCVRVASNAIQVLGGSGYMEDYPLERLYRDARITTIYEGTSQLQVVAAIRGVTSGIAEKYFCELESAAVPESLEDLGGKLKETREILAGAVDFLKQTGDSNYTDLCARRLVDTTIDILSGYLLLRHAGLSDRKVLVARHFMAGILPRARAMHELVASGEKAAITDYAELVGPVIE